MKRIELIFGLLIGTILCINMTIMVNQIYSNPDFKPNDVIGWVAMVVVFSLIFFGVRQYRNKNLNGFISFGEAFKTGFMDQNDMVLNKNLITLLKFNSFEFYFIYLQ